AADPHDLVRVHPRRGAAGAGQGGRRRDALRAGRRGVQRHARRDDLRHLLHAGVLRRRPLDHVPHGLGPPAARQAGGAARGGAAAGAARGRGDRRDAPPEGGEDVMIRKALHEPSAGAAARASPLRRSSPLGAAVVDGGVNFSLFSRTATGVELVFFDREDDAAPSRVVTLDPAANRTYHYWHAFEEGVLPGQLYGYRVAGPPAPERGLRF